MMAAASFSVRMDLSLNSSNDGDEGAERQAHTQAACGQNRAVGETGSVRQDCRGHNVHLLALLIALHLAGQSGGALLGEQIFVEGLGVIVVAGKQLVLLLDARAHGGAALVDANLRFAASSGRSVACSITPWYW